jgi:hypothetical protein
MGEELEGSQMTIKVKTLAQEEAELDYVARMAQKVERLVTLLVEGKLRDPRLIKAAESGLKLIGNHTRSFASITNRRKLEADLAKIAAKL